jgi:hypothetical protein
MNGGYEASIQGWMSLASIEAKELCISKVNEVGKSDLALLHIGKVPIIRLHDVS